MKTAMRQFQLTARAYHRMMKFHRRIADLAGWGGTTQVHLAEALQHQLKNEGEERHIFVIFASTQALGKKFTQHPSGTMRTQYPLGTMSTHDTPRVR